MAGIQLSATYYCLAGSSRCTVGHPDVAGLQLYAAISPDLAYLRGRSITVWYGERHVTVTVIDCNCQAHRAIDLYADAFRQLAPLSLGRIWVMLE